MGADGTKPPRALALAWAVLLAACASGGPASEARGPLRSASGDLDATVDGARGRGVEPARHEDYPGGVRKVVYRDPDGNEIGFGGAPAA